jgi:putative acetyltransferase
MIRGASESDAEAICALHVASIREVCGLVYDARAIEAWAGSKRSERYRAAMRESIMLVAEREGVIAGFGDLHIASAELRGLYVRPDSLRRGIGRQVLQALEEAGRKRGLHRIDLRATLNAIPFYQAQGYDLGEMTTFPLGAGLTVACAMFHKAL